jgi:hypothetical protein
MLIAFDDRREAQLASGEDDGSRGGCGQPKKSRRVANHAASNHPSTVLNPV